jgi:hypothetical protein
MSSPGGYIVTSEMESMAIRESGKREWKVKYLADASRE